MIEQAEKLTLLSESIELLRKATLLLNDITNQVVLLQKELTRGSAVEGAGEVVTERPFSVIMDVTEIPAVPAGSGTVAPKVCVVTVHRKHHRRNPNAGIPSGFQVLN
jgi:hypothetical protein